MTECVDLLQRYNLTEDFDGGSYCTDLNSCKENDIIESENPLSTWTIFGYGFIAVTIINLSSIGGLMVVPLMRKQAYSRLLLFFIAMAASALLSNALFHLIPQVASSNKSQIYCLSVFRQNYRRFYRH